MEKIFDTKEAAEYLKISEGTLENWRYVNKGPKFRKPEGKVYYTESDLKEWLSSE